MWSKLTLCLLHKPVLNSKLEMLTQKQVVTCPSEIEENSSKISHNITKHNEGLSLKGWIVIGFLAIFTVFTLAHYFLKLGRENADPLLDPHFNPNIRVIQKNPNFHVIHYIMPHVLFIRSSLKN
uniref:Uncharacterized protein n=1 Tax=Tetranychus urticae TaxID=32264 RepID=T1KNX0_TETUR